MAGELHQRLIGYAAKWLSKKHAVVITDMVSASTETPDAIGFSGYYGSTLIEVKVSRADFLADQKKRHRVTGGMGDKRYFMAPENLLKPEEMPEGWGLLVPDDAGKVKTAREAIVRKGADHDAERNLLVSAIRRIGQTAPQGVSIKCYTIETKRGATMGILPLEAKRSVAGEPQATRPDPSGNLQVTGNKQDTEG